MGLIPTVKVRNPDVPGECMIINESDFQEGVHELFDAPPKPAGKPRKKNEKPDPLEGVKFATPEAAAAAAAAGLTAEHFAGVAAKDDNGFTEAAVAEIAALVAAGDQK